MVFAGATALALTGGGLRVANAQSTPTPSTPTTQSQQPNASQPGDNGGAGDQADANVTSSVTVPQTPDNGQDNEAAQDAALAKVATVTPDQAKAAALKAVPGTAATPELSDENGNVVYDVTVTSPDGRTTTDVKVDAGNAKVLAQQVDNEGADHEGSDNGKADQPGAPETPDTGQQGAQDTGN